MDSLKDMSNADVKYMLKNCAWREVTTTWVVNLEEEPKLLCYKSWLLEDWCYG